MKTETERCPGTSDRLVLVIMVLVGVSTSLLVLCIYLFLQNKKLFKRLG